VLAESDSEPFFKLSQNSEQLWDDIVNLKKRSNNPNELDCLSELESELEKIKLHLDALGTLVGLASAMNDFSDEQMVLREVRGAAKDFTSDLEISRKFVSKSCSWSKAVSAQAQAILQLFEQVRRQITVTAVKIDASATYGRPRDGAHVPQ
jgi:hypothetical protein